MGGPCSTNGGEEEAYRLLVGKPEGKRPLGRPRRRWMDNIRMDLGEVGWGDDCLLNKQNLGLTPVVVPYYKTISHNIIKS
jgi:hypothetical protein